MGNTRSVFRETEPNVIGTVKINTEMNREQGKRMLDSISK